MEDLETKIDEKTGKIIIKRLAFDESGNAHQERYYYYKEQGYDFVDEEYLFEDELE